MVIVSPSRLSMSRSYTMSWDYGRYFKTIKPITPLGRCPIVIQTTPSNLGAEQNTMNKDKKRTISIILVQNTIE